jgi:SpoVK/Ycf46/Vps4 family AAA+-type ATPase
MLLRFGTLLDRAEAWQAVAARVEHRFAAYEGPLVLLTTHNAAPLHHAVADVVEVPVEHPTAAVQARLWARALAEAGVDSEAEELSRRFSVTPGIMRAAVRDAVAHARVAGEPTARLAPEAISPFVRRRLDHALSEVAEPFSTALDWADVVLTPDVRDALDEIVLQARHRHRVFDEWGFGTKLSYGTGIGCLFSGPPGTGKTTMAGIIARTLGRELYRVDLSRVVSKWVGETEKNLGRLFAEAEKAQVILLFDEADSLFATRTEVKGANDRFANMEVNYLLQRMETYDGISILTTNFERAIDEAFKRRLRFRVHFPLPEADERAELWRRLLPAAVPKADDLRFDELGRKYKLAGGHIKNAVLRAAFCAADEGTPVTFELLDRAARVEMREMGRL